jgi:hypothetical protein
MHTSSRYTILAVGGRPVRSLWRRIWTTLSLWTAGGLALSCSGDTTNPTSISAAQTYWALRLNYHAVNMATVAPYDTIQLTATPVNPAGAPLSELGTVTYTTGDSNLVVSPTGLITAHSHTQAGNPSFVVAHWTDQTLNQTRADTAYVQVTDTIPQHRLKTFSIQPLSGDSAKRAVGFANNLQWPIFATDSANNTVCTATLNADATYAPTCALQVSFTTSDPTVAIIQKNGGEWQVNLLRPGHVTFYATTTAYGITLRDSLPFVVGWPASAHIAIDWVYPVKSTTPVPAFTPARVSVAGGANVDWAIEQDYTQVPPDSVDVVFDDSAAVQPGCAYTAFLYNCNYETDRGGNIPPMYPDEASLDSALAGEGSFQTIVDVYASLDHGRKFPTVGRYRYHSRRYPMATGEVDVFANP